MKEYGEYDGSSSTDPCVTLHIQNSRHFQILLRTMCSSSIFNTLAYSEYKAYS